MLYEEHNSYYQKLLDISLHDGWRDVWVGGWIYVADIRTGDEQVLVSHGDLDRDP